MLGQVTGDDKVLVKLYTGGESVKADNTIITTLAHHHTTKGSKEEEENKGEGGGGGGGGVDVTA
ncbi:hypothetical protein E2C01_067597 [Portunus trituberculatus]|uniref:Uncharacterized protein n=1 Tax=Portunus trituberculatus TaxID=210409 RepID=A0A5B7HXV0_PORTR|nr:hypothetical protein [Portunus trituberculatus]